MHLEGIVSKRLDAPYQSGRVETWTKSKCRAGHEVVIGGYTTTNGVFRSLIAGVNRDGKLVEVGRIGTGFGREKVAQILPKLRALETDKSPVRRQSLAAQEAGKSIGCDRNWSLRSSTRVSRPTVSYAKRLSRPCARTSRHEMSRPRAGPQRRRS